MLVSFKNRRVSFEVVVRNMKENAYNTKIITTYSKSLFYASVTPPVSILKLLIPGYGGIHFLSQNHRNTVMRLAC